MAAGGVVVAQGCLVAFHQRQQFHLLVDTVGGLREQVSAQLVEVDAAGLAVADDLAAVGYDGADMVAGGAIAMYGIEGEVELTGQPIA